ncbi:MAG: class I SAM-dependent methyltransferase [Victivallales bacterium]|nr:class I SAM-dependent methyltransferase [Victivallales bacterium]
MIYDKYSQYYNLIYQDKTYAEEVEYINKLIKKYSPDVRSVLDVGCETGKHAHFLSEKAYQAEGLDLSETMLGFARSSYPDIVFHHGDARNFNIGKKYDAVTSLFHVACYQKSNRDLINYFSSIKEHLRPQGLFIFDFWYGPGVLSDKPLVRVKRLEDENIKVTRIAEPALHDCENAVDVNYEIIIESKADSGVERISEKHEVRYFFLPELELMLELSGFTVLDCFEWLKYRKPNSNCWFACIAAKRAL